ncbi:MAG: carboxypeptidase regulatory-like domain-containing protein [Bryobacterales bacterium]|nr:carboxypeptidase regulatory-like domain-containing protein [Bryobacterales bacterium]
MTISRLFSTLPAAALLLLSASSARAQSVQGSIVGAVTDPTGAPVAGAAVTVINEGKNFERTATTEPSGDYRVSGLEAGSYSVVVALRGFKTFRQTRVDLTLGQNKRIDARLEVGDVSTTVTVEGGASQIETESATLSNLKTDRDYKELPLSVFGRGWANVTNVVAGVQSSSGFEVNGAPDMGNNFTSDGISVNDNVSSRNTPNGFSGEVEMIQEIKVMTANNSAEYAQVAQFAAISKSGTNQFHGSLFWEDWNSFFSARSWADRSAPSFTNSNEFAATSGGPVLIPKLYNGKNKTFYFFSYGGQRYRIGNRQYLTVPTAGFEQGDFSSLLGKITVRDPLNGQPFANNVIPSSRISPVASALQKLVYPAPNLTGQGSYGLLNNFTADPGGQYNSDVYSVRVDQKISEKNTIFARVGLTIHNQDVYPGSLNQGYGGGYYDNFPGRSLVVSDTHILSPAVVNEAKLGYNRTANFFYDTNFGADVQSQLGINGITNSARDPAISGMPSFNFNGANGFAGTGNFANGQGQAQNEYQLIDRLSWIKGAHAFKFGGEVHRYQVNDISKPIAMRGSYSFDDQLSGLDYANFLLGLPSSAQLAIPRPSAYLRSTLAAFFAQDEFKLNSRMTLTYGVRYTYQTPWVDKFDRLFSFDPAGGSLVTAGSSLPADLVPAVAATLPIKPASQAGFPTRSLVNTDGNNFDPRVGLAIRPFADTKTVFRFGYGVYTQMWAGLRGLNATGGPWQSTQTWTIQNNQPLIAFPSPFAATSRFSGVQSISALGASFPNTRSQQWTASVGRQVLGIALDAAYVGTRGLNLPFADDLNLLRPSTNPFNFSQLPYQRFSSVLITHTGGSSIYHGFTLQADRRMAKGLFFNINYTLSKALTDVNLRSTAPTAQQNQYQRYLERSDDPNLRRQQLRFSYVYELPFGRGQRFLNTLPKAGNLMLGGWQLSGITTMLSGAFLTPTYSGVDAANTNQFSGRPDRIGNGNLDSGSMRGLIKSRQPVLDKSAFAVPAAGRGYYGNSARNILNGPGSMVWNIVAAKNFLLSERARFQFRCETFNTFNRANFSNPVTNISSGSFGLVTSAGSGRNLMLGLRLDY